MLKFLRSKDLLELWKQNLPGIAYAREWACRNFPSSFPSDNSSTFNLVDPDDLEPHKELIAGSESTNATSATNANLHGMIDTEGIFRYFARFGKVMEKDRLTVLGEEHSTKLLVCR
ncbi:protein NUCLEAR FUSION DEFECTIVE 4-like isoform X1 [Prunus yedoensis var. nudiflora]|uniref:Protein NUCLEAR FUSION DEFECTIVE 4-like isoform X1 n=1 Tax=Prunus yedoensis var. nudiflora TaxID=2094558 RepID=A0A314UAK9_PRUYE|nr:protein NUCLEAR FUSION DEFECTIVE 4-like isoform X1 [Prunus yedoensis var. nudiflora]